MEASDHEREVESCSDALAALSWPVPADQSMIFTEAWLAPVWFDQKMVVKRFQGEPLNECCDALSRWALALRCC